MLVVVTLPKQELIVFLEILLEQLLIELDLVMTLVRLRSIKEVQWELESQIIYVLFCQWYEVVLPGGDSTDYVDIWDVDTRSEGVHLHFHVPLEIPSEHIVLKGSRLSENELDDLWMLGCQNLSDLSKIKI